MACPLGPVVGQANHGKLTPSKRKRITHVEAVPAGQHPVKDNLLGASRFAAFRLHGPPPSAGSYPTSLMTCFFPCSSGIAIIRSTGAARPTPGVEAMALTVSGGRNWPEPALVLLTPWGMTATDPGALPR